MQSVDININFVSALPKNTRNVKTMSNFEKNNEKNCPPARPRPRHTFTRESGMHPTVRHAPDSQACTRQLNRNQALDGIPITETESKPIDKNLATRQKCRQ